MTNHIPEIVQLSDDPGMGGNWRVYNKTTDEYEIISSK